MMYSSRKLNDKKARENEEESESPIHGPFPMKII